MPVSVWMCVNLCLLVWETGGVERLRRRNLVFSCFLTGARYCRKFHSCSSVLRLVRFGTFFCCKNLRMQAQFFSPLNFFFLFALTLTPCVSELYLRLLGEQTHHISTQNTIDSHSLIRLRSFLLNETLSFTRLLPSPESYNSKTCKTKYRESVRCKRNEKEIAQKSYTFGR